jgi:RNA polymerase sigma factor (sigma-70 family)
MLRLFGRQPWVKDVLHNAYETFLDKRHTFRGEGTIEAFADSIALNKARDQMRRQQRTAIVHDLLRQSPQWSQIVPTPDVETDLRERMRRLTAIIEGIGPTYRIPYLLYNVENRTVPEIARIEQTTEAAIRKRLTRAREKIYAEARLDPVLAEWLRERDR